MDLLLSIALEAPFEGRHIKTSTLPLHSKYTTTELRIPLLALDFLSHNVPPGVPKEV